MDMRNNLFGKGRSQIGLPGRVVNKNQTPPPPPGNPYASSAINDTQSSYGTPPPPSQYGGPPSPPINRQSQRTSGGGGGGGGAAAAAGMYGGAAVPAPQVQLRIEKLPKGSLADQYVFGNLCAVSSDDFQSRDGGDVYVLLKGPQMRGECVVTARPTPGFPRGCISLSDPQRQWCGIGLMDSFFGERYDPFSQGQKVYLGTMDLEISFASPRKTPDAPYDQDELADIVVKQYGNQIFSPGQRFLMDLQGVPLSFAVKTVQLIDLSGEKGDGSDAPSTSAANARGILTNVATINFFKDANSPIKLKGSARRPAANAIIRPDFNFADMGIGGLDNEFQTIFRRAFTSRILPPGLIEQMGIPHVKGMLLYGPPGTGKTLIARQIGKMLNAREPKIINGPEVLNKFVGQSEENIRKMFADAEKEYKEKGEESGLHIIIFDELDAVCKQRGSGAGGGTGVGDSVVNQLLTKLDGVEQLNNILLIGMTNRKDMIDDALLRPGRLEVHVEISLPDEQGRQQILKIHTDKMRNNGRLEDDVDISDLAARTKNFSGAEINGLVKAAASYAFERHTKVGGMVPKAEDIQDIKVSHADFLRALDDVKPAFGVSEAELEAAVAGGIIPFSPHIDRIRGDGRLYADQIMDSDTRLLSVLLHGPRHSGKTALAADIGLNSEFPFAKLVRADDMLGMSEQSKIDHLRRVFNDAYKSPVSLIILDEIEAMIEWSPIGPRFQNSVLVAIYVLTKKIPPKDRRLLILGTTSQRGVFSQLNLSFTRELAVPAISDFKQLSVVLSTSRAFQDPADVNDALNELQQATGSQRVDVGVSKVLDVMRTAEKKARQQGRPVGSVFAGEMADVINMNTPAL